MTKEEILNFETRLNGLGYKKIERTKAESMDTYEWYKAFRDSKGELIYQIFFCFWDFSIYRDPYAGWSVSVVILPESCKNNVGRRDLQLSVDWSTNVEKVERCAEGFYSFIRTIDEEE